MKFGRHFERLEDREERFEKRSSRIPDIRDVKPSITMAEAVKILDGLFEKATNVQATEKK